jgi:hypothetical protein
MTGSLVIVSRFCGPPDSGNGGYVCGLIAGYLDGPAEVTLRKPPPLETPLNLERDGGGSVRVRDGQTLIAEATSSPNGPALQLPDPVSVQQARSAGARSHLRVHPGLHPFPTCFVCGPDRRPGDGLRILVGCPPTLSLMTMASLMVRTQVQEKAPPVVFRRGFGVRGGGLVVSLR